MLIPQPDPFTITDLENTPDDGRRYEIEDGRLSVTPHPAPVHNWIADQLQHLLSDAAPPEEYVITSVGVRLNSDQQFRIPDVTVAALHPITAGPYYNVPEVLAVVEVVAPMTRLMDRITKPAVYAEAGIPCMWRVETDPFPGQLSNEQLPVIFVYRLTTAGAELVARLSAGTVGTAPLPFPVTFDPAVLVE